METAPKHLDSEKIAVSAPMSFSGSAKRILNVSDNIFIRLFLLYPAILVAWCFVACWYILFGLLLVPYRLVRRGSRKRKLADARHQETLQAIQNSQAVPPKK